MKKLIALISFALVASLSWAVITVTGVVISSEDGEPVIGASVLEKGTSNGTITDFDGNFTLTVKEKSVIVISYVGMVTAEMTAAPKMKVTLRPDAIAVEEVVVTAMGVVQEKKRMNFAVQNVNSNDLTEGRSANVLNALQGKVAGVSVTTTGGSPNSGSAITLRGVSSISSTQSNEPLIILDGMPLTGGAGDINPNDVESITVLKGAAASALYGQEAANGVLMITTKSAKAGKVQASVNASWEFDTPANMIQTQTMYLPGSNGFYHEKTKNGWGPVVADGTVLYDNVRNFFNDYGFYHKYDLSLTGGTDKFQAMASASYSKNDGIVPADYRQKVTALVKGSYKPNKYIDFSLMSNIIHNTYRSATGVSSIYSWPINDDITNFEDEQHNIRFLYYDDKYKYNSPFSPLYSRYNDYGVNKQTRSLLQGTMAIHPVKGLDITARLSLDQNNYSYDGYSIPRFDDSRVVENQDSEGYWTTPVLTKDELATISKSSLGSYSNSSSESRLLTTNVTAMYHLDLPKDFGLDVMLGWEAKDRQSIGSSISGRDFVIPGVYSVTNLSEINGTSDVSVSHSHRRMMGVFGEIRADYAGLATLSITSRWDWSSTLAQEYCPYWYPSITAGLVFSQLIPAFKETKNDWFSFGKIRGNYARVGKDAPAYLFDRRFTQFATLPDGGYSTYASYSVGFELKPEMASSWEIGADLRFLKSRLRMDVAYYSQSVENQIVTVRVPLTTGHVLQTRNEGTVTNHGFELTLDGDIIKKNGWTWTAGINFAFNRGKVVSLPEGMTEIEGSQYGDLYPTAYLGGSTTGISGKDYLRTEDGQVVCDENGYPKINPSKSVLIGNREPLFQAGLNTSVHYKGFGLSLQFEGRVGGDVANVTGRGLWSSGMNKAIENYRGRQVVWKGVVNVGTEDDPIYEQNTKPIVLDATTINNYFYAVSSNFIEDGSYLRLQYASLSYDFASLLKKVEGIEGVRIAFTGTNLFLLTKYTGSDPAIGASSSAAGVGSNGIDNYPVPTTRGYNLSLQVTF